VDDDFDYYNNHKYDEHDVYNEFYSEYDEHDVYNEFDFKYGKYDVFNLKHNHHDNGIGVFLWVQIFSMGMMLCLS
jgi:hypothetical protein